jgi:hypothetical protein
VCHILPTHWQEFLPPPMTTNLHARTQIKLPQVCNLELRMSRFLSLAFFYYCYGRSKIA